jgi:hypothetical protein
MNDREIRLRHHQTFGRWRAWQFALCLVFGHRRHWTHHRPEHEFCFHCGKTMR